EHARFGRILVVGRERCLFERRGGRFVLAALAVLERTTDEGIRCHHIWTWSRCSGGKGGNDQDNHATGSRRAATVRTIASISCVSDRRWPPSFRTFSWTSAERSCCISV